MVCRRLVALSLFASLSTGRSVASNREEIRYELTSESWFGLVGELSYWPDSITNRRGTFFLRETGEEGRFRIFDGLALVVVNQDTTPAEQHMQAGREQAMTNLPRVRSSSSMAVS